MPADLLIRPATAEDTNQILDLMKVSLGEGKIPRQLEYWRWKHEANPFGPSPVLLALAEGRLVGLRVFMRWNWRACGREVHAVRAVDTATHPDWQGRGIFSRLTLALLDEMRASGVAFVFNTPNTRSRPGYVKMGWVILGRPSVWVRPVASPALIGALLSFGDHAESGHSTETGQAGASPARHLLDEPGFARFCDALPECGDRLSTAPTPDYLRWRYVAVPGFDYEAAWSLAGDEGAALIFRTKRRGRLRELRLCQILVGGGDRSQKLGRELLRSLVDRTSASYITGMATFGTSAQRLLLRSGFLPAPRSGPILTVRPLADSTGGPDPLRRSDWQLSIGDLELF